jgi:hypothetical protein
MRTSRVLSLLGSFAAVFLSVSVAVGADFPDRPGGRFGGIYKVTSSTDPMFPATGTREYFLDFGRGIQADKLSGSVAVSVRRNPNVQVRIMAWQYFPDQGKIVIGNPYAEGSRKAVAMGAWQMKGIANGVLFERGSYRVVLQRADPDDY